MDFNLVQFIRERYRIILPILAAFLLITGVLVYQSRVRVDVSQPLAADLSADTCANIQAAHCGGTDYSDCGTAICLQGGAACPSGYTAVTSSTCTPCCISFPQESPYHLPPKLETCERLPLAAALTMDECPACAPQGNPVRLDCPTAKNATCSNDPAWPRCTGRTGVGVYETVADSLRTGNLDWDRSTNLLYNRGGGRFDDITQWTWYKAPTTLTDWCEPGSPSRLVKVSPPPTRPCAINSTRCIDGSSGGLDYTTCRLVPSSIGPSVTPSPSSSVVPVTPLFCAPAVQTISLGQFATVQASGGDGTYRWDFYNGGVLESGGTSSVTVSYPAIGQKTLQVNSGGLIARCTVNVVSAGISPAPSISPLPSGAPAALSLTKQGRNSSIGDPGEHPTLSINPGQTAQFIVRIANIGGSATANLSVRDEVPFGMSYVAGSLLVEGQSIPYDTITTGGLMLGRLDPADTVTVQWSAIADQTAQISGASQQSQPRVRASADGVSEVAAEMSVTVFGSGGIPIGTSSGSPGGLSTGPGDAVTVALVVAALLTLLYSGYTRSMAYRKHEADVVSRGHEPMDFRS